MIVSELSTAYGIIDMWYSAGGDIKSHYGDVVTTSGVWHPKRSGFRIAVLDEAGEPAFTYG